MSDTLNGPDGVALIAAERQRQIEQEGWTPEGDDTLVGGHLAIAAAVYAMPPDDDLRLDTHQRVELPSGVVREVPYAWPFESAAFKPCPTDRVRELVKAGALIAAEIDRLLRAANAEVVAS
jgi:hypothetical protein